MKKWEPCPRCGSKRVQTASVGALVAFGICVACMGVPLLIFPYAGIPLILIGIALAVFAPMAKSTLLCKDCRHSWVYPAEENPSHQTS